MSFRNLRRRSRSKAAKKIGNFFRPTIEALENRLVPATIHYNASSDTLTFTADNNEADNVTITSPAPNMLRITVSGDTITLDGDAGSGSTPSAGFTLTGGTQFDIVNTSTTPVASFNINLGNMDDSLAFGLANSVVTDVSIDGGADTDAITLNSFTLPSGGDLTVLAAETINVSGTVSVPTSVALSATTINFTTGGSLTSTGGNVTLTATTLADATDDNAADVEGDVVTLNITGGIGASSSNYLEINARTQLNASTSNSGIFIKDLSGNLPLGSVSAGNGTVNLWASGGAITDTNAASVNVSGGTVELTGKSGIGTFSPSDDPIETTATQLTARATDLGAVINIKETDGLSAVTAITNAGKVTITNVPVPTPPPTVTPVSLTFDDATQVLNASGAAITFETTSGNVKVGLVDGGTNAINITAANAILDDATNDATVDIITTGDVTLVAGIGGIGALGSEIDTQVGRLAGSTTGAVFVHELDSLSLLHVSASGMITLQANGAILDGNGGSVNLTTPEGVTLTTLGSSSAIGTSSDAIETAIGTLNATTNDGGIYIADSNGPGLIINNVLAKQSGKIPYVDANHQVIYEVSGGPPLVTATGTHDVNVSATGPVLLNNVTAPDQVAISSGATILDINQASPNILAQHVTLSTTGAGDVGHEFDPIELTSEFFSASTSNGEIFLAQAMVSTAVSVVASGTNKDVVVTSTAGSLIVQTITATGTATVASNGGLLLDDNNNSTKITGQIVDLTGKAGVGTALNRIDTASTTRLSATATDLGAVIYVDESNTPGLVSATTNDGHVAITFAAGSLTFDADDPDQLLNGSGTAIAFETTTGDVKIGLVDAGNNPVTIIAAGAILDDGNDTTTDIIGSTTILTSGTASDASASVRGIGVSGNKIETKVTSLTATAFTGGIFVSNDSTNFTLAATASETEANIDIDTTGNMTVMLVSASGDVTLDAGGAISDGNGVLTNVAGDTLEITGVDGIGVGDALETAVNTLTADSSSGGIELANNKAVKLISATASANIVISAVGNMTLGIASGQNVTLIAFGQMVDDNAADNNITADTITLGATKIGTLLDKIETVADVLNASTTTGGIFISNTSASLELTASALGQAADIDIDTTGDMVLNAIIAKGDTVKLRAGDPTNNPNSSITDGNDTIGPPATHPVNITARTLDIAAPNGIGTEDNPLETDVHIIELLDGGAAGAYVYNVGQLAITKNALEAPGSGKLTFNAESITILDITDVDNTATVAPGRSLELLTLTGNIVFLDANDTIETSGGGTITVKAGTGPVPLGTDPGGAVAVLGNLKTNGGDILIEADHHITIGLLDAGSGAVTVHAGKFDTPGIIIDGNGPAINIIAGTTTLIGDAPTSRDAELDETFRIAEAAAADAEAAAKLTSAESFGNAKAIIDAAEATAQSAVTVKTPAVTAANTAVVNQKAVVTGFRNAKATLEGIAAALDIAETIADGIAAHAQAVPFTGDGGTATAAFFVSLATKAANAAVFGVGVKLDLESIVLGDLEHVLTLAQAELFAAESTLALATATAQAFAEAFSITQADAEKAVIVAAALAQVRDQAIHARDQVNVIGTFDEPLGLNVSGDITITAGPTDSYLEVTGPAAIALIDAESPGGVTLISTGAITDADNDGGDDIRATTLRIVAAGGIGTTANPLETRVEILNATNTTAGHIVIVNNTGAPGPLNITGITNTAGNVSISNTGNSAQGQGITVTGAISATGAGATVTILSGSPLVLDASSSTTASGAIVYEAGETADAGDDLTAKSGVVIESTDDSVTLRAGDNLTIESGATIKADTTITLTADYNDGPTDLDSTGANVVVAGTLIAPSATINVDPDADDNDTFTITPSLTTPITVNAEDGVDTLNFIANGLNVTIVGNTITADGHAPVTFNNFESINIINASGIGTITLIGTGDADSLDLDGTAPGAGTFTLTGAAVHAELGGVPVSFSGMISFVFNAGDQDDTASVTPYATHLLPWNLVATINGEGGTDRIVYNNVAGMAENTRVTAVSLGAGRIESSGVSSAANDLVVQFSGVEDITANANPGEDDELTINLRNSSLADRATLLFATGSGDDIQLAGLFDLVVDTDNYVNLTVNGNGGADIFDVTLGGPALGGVGDVADTMNIVLDGGTPNGLDRLVLRDDGATDLTVVHFGADTSTGSVTVGLVNPIHFQNMERLDVTPLDPINGPTGKVKVFHPDPWEFNDNRFNAIPLARLGEWPTSPTIDPGAVYIPPDEILVGGDEDWYEFRPTVTSTFQIKILFDKHDLLPGDGDLSLEIYDATGTLITTGTAAADGAVATFAATPDVAKYARIFIRVTGATPDAINVYDFDNLEGGGVTNVDKVGPQVTDVRITGQPTYNLFAQKNDADLVPTPLVHSITISLQDQPNRAPGYIYEALKLAVAQTPGIFQVRGDNVGIVAISSIEVTNNPPSAGAVATATIVLTFATPLPDDRYTLTILDNLTDVPGNKLDGENNAAEPTNAPTFPSGDGQPGGNFVARFTVDSRPEIGTYGSTLVSVDINGNGLWDPRPELPHSDLIFHFALVNDDLFAGNFHPTKSGMGSTANGYDKFGAYGLANGAYRFLIDFNGNGAIEAGETIISSVQVNAFPVAGNFDGNADNGDEIGLFTGQDWYLDFNGNNNLEANEKRSGNMAGIPMVGDFDGDGTDDLAVYRPHIDQWDFDLNRDGNIDASIIWGVPGVIEKALAADMNRDGVDDLILFKPASVGPSGEQAEWLVLMSDPNGPRTFGAASLHANLNHPFSPKPLGRDALYNFGHSAAIPIVGNFDPPIGAAPGGTTPPATITWLANNTGSFTDKDGDTYTVKLTGPGKVAVVLDEVNGGIAKIYLEGTTSASSDLGISVRKAKKGDGFVRVADIEGSGLRSLNAAKLHLIGGIDLGDQALGTLALRSAVGARISVGPLGKASFTGEVTNTSINIAGNVSQFSAGALISSQLSIGSAPSIATLGKLSIKGQVRDSAINVTGNVNQVSVGAFIDSQLFAGFKPTDEDNPMAGGVFSGASINTFTVVGVKGITSAFSNAVVAAQKIGKATISSLNTSNGTQRFGFFTESFTSIAIKKPKLTLKTPQLIGDFQAGIV